MIVENILRSAPIRSVGSTEYQWSSSGGYQTAPCLHFVVGALGSTPEKKSQI